MKFGTIVFIFLQSMNLFSLCSSEQVLQEYDNDFISLVEMVYGEGLLSQGGIHSIDEMLYGIDLEGLKVLDLGCGLGMYDIYLAKYHNTEIIAVDPLEKLIQKANLNLEDHKKTLVGSVSFLVMKNPNNLNEFLDDSFDVVFSKESMLHVPYEAKENCFKEIYRVLKPGGKIIIMDWMHSSPVYTDDTRRMMEMDGLTFQLLTPLEYQNILKSSGFDHIELADTTLKHAEISQQNMDTIIAIEDRIKTQFGEDAYKYSLESWTYQRNAFQTRELLTGILRANKGRRL